jgi:hypothetical protein
MIPVPVDSIAITERLAAQAPEEKRIRNELMRRGVGPREATRRAAVATGRIPASRAAPGAPSRALAEVAVAAVSQATAARKRARKVAKRAARETSARRLVLEEAQLAARFSEAALTTGLREASNEDLADIGLAALASQPAPPARPVVDVATPPSAMDFDELALVALAGSAGSAPFYAASPGVSLPAGWSPFYTYRPAGGATKGTADA